MTIKMMAAKSSTSGLLQIENKFNSLDCTIEPRAKPVLV
jgi:hypothetical protein